MKRNLFVPELREKLKSFGQPREYNLGDSVVGFPHQAMATAIWLMVFYLGRRSEPGLVRLHPIPPHQPSSDKIRRLMFYFTFCHQVNNNYRFRHHDLFQLI
jgi:hypothetical protein